MGKRHHVPTRILIELRRALRLRRKTPKASGKSYNAVTVASTAKCCQAAKDTQAKPILVRNFPRLPLPGCSMPDHCRCRLREWPDRRIGERRLPADSGTRHSPDEPQRRAGRDRRR